MALTVAMVVNALAELGGQARPAEIAARIKATATVSLPSTLLQGVRARIQERSSDSKSVFKGKEDLFYSVHGIGNGVWGLRALDPLSPTYLDGFQDAAETVGRDSSLAEAEEGALILRTHLRRERSRKLVEAFKAQLASWECRVCDFDFAEVYGPIGQGLIEAHHTVPVASIKPGHVTKIEDLVALCSNCHRVIHREHGLDWRVLRSRVKRRERED